MDDKIVFAVSKSTIVNIFKILAIALGILILMAIPGGVMFLIVAGSVAAIMSIHKNDKDNDDRK